MGLRAFKPTSAGRRFYTVSDFKDLTRDEPEAKLCEPKPSSGGRNHYGRITSRFRGGGHKQAYRVIDFKRTKLDMPALILPAIQINIRAGEFPAPETNGTAYLKIPLNLF